MIIEIFKSNNSKKLILITNNELLEQKLGELNLYIQPCLEAIWKSPKLVTNLLLNADLKDVKKNLAPLIVNNFYENILSPNDKEYHLLYIMTTLLKHEINNLNNLNFNSNKFLSNS